MRIAGIIAEYDPFHKGHAYHIAKTKEFADAVVVVLGGELTQRGEPAWCSKNLRTKCALACGADLVLELPAYYACASAERFAGGGVAVLSALGCVDFLSFGSECGCAADIAAFAALADSEAFIEEVKIHQKSGLSAPAARQKAAERLAPKLAHLCQSPNDTLGAEYCKWLARAGGKIEPVAVPRRGALHGEAPRRSGFASASYLRSLPKPTDALPYLPAEIRPLIIAEYTAGRLPVLREKYEAAALSRLRAMSEQDFAAVPDCAAEGLYHRVFEASRRAGTLDGLYTAAKTRRYTMSRIKRIAAAAAVGLREEIFADGALPYVHVLGMNETGARVLREAKAANTGVPIGASLAELAKASPRAAAFAAAENAAEDLWQLCLKIPGECGKAFTEKVVVAD